MEKNFRKIQIKNRNNGLRPMPSFKFDYPEHNILKTFLTQEMLKGDFLANTIYVSISHSERILKNIFIIMKKF